MKVFDEAGDDFDRLSPLLWEPVATRLVEVSAPSLGERVLDACCGSGSSALPTALAVGASGHVDAVDTSAVLVEALDRRPDRPSWLHPHVHDVTGWSSPEPYDLVQCGLGIFFLPDMAAGTGHLASLARPGGRVVASVWRHGALVAVGEALAAARRRVTGEDFSFPRSPLAGIDRPEILGPWLEEHGLRDVQVIEQELVIVLDEDAAWLLVTGSAWRWAMAELDPAVQGLLREAFRDEVRERRLLLLDATTLVATGTRPG